jgi:integrase
MPRKARGYWLEQRHNGVWYVAWTHDRRKHARSTGTRDQGEAQAWLARFLAALEQPDPPARPTLAAALDGYLADRHGRVVDYPRLELCARHLTRRLGWLTLEELRPSHSRSYAAARAREGISDGTIRRELLCLRSALRWAANERWLDLLPGVPAPPKPAPRDRWLAREEASALEAATIAPHVRLFVQLALGTAASSGALRTLRWAQVDLDNAMIDFGRGVGNKRRAVVPINDRLLALLREAREAAQTEYVLEHNGRAAGSIKKAFARAVARAGIAHCSPHDLRRTAGSWLLQAGVPIEVVSAMLGHSDVRVTQAVYAHWNVDFLRGAADVLGGSLRVNDSLTHPKPPDQSAKTA